jgi:hypothetical protein
LLICAAYNFHKKGKSKMPRTLTSKRTSGKHLPLTVLTAIFIIGLIGGIVICAAAEKPFAERIINAAAGFLRSRSSLGFAETLAESFFSSSVIIMLFFILGFGGIYQPVSVTLLAFRGLGIGTALSFIYAGGITPQNFFAVSSVLPFIALTSFIHIIACRESIRMSTSVLRISLAAPGEYTPVSYSLYINKFVILMFSAAVVSVLDAAVNVLV